MPVELEIRKLVLELGSSSSSSTISLFDFLSKIEFFIFGKMQHACMAEPRFDSRKAIYNMQHFHF